MFDIGPLFFGGRGADPPVYVYRFEDTPPLLRLADTFEAFVRA